MAENTMLYFRSVADEDNDDGAESAATNLTTFFIVLKNTLPIFLIFFS